MVGGGMMLAWMQQPHNTTIADRLVHLSNSPFSSEQPSRSHAWLLRREHLRSVASVQTRSMASSSTPLSTHSNTPAPTPTPSLSYSHSQPASSADESFRTSLVSLTPGLPLLTDNNGVLEQQLPDPNPLLLLQLQPTYECVFWFLHCTYTSHDRGEWSTHCTSHLRTAPPPRCLSCPLCPFTSTTSTTTSTTSPQDSEGSTAWTAHLSHLADAHFVQGHSLRTAPPKVDVSLVTYLWQKHVIGAQTYKDLTAGTYEGVYVSTSRTRSRRREPAPGRGTYMVVRSVSSEQRV